MIVKKNHKTKNSRQNRHLRKMDMNGKSASKHNYLNKSMILCTYIWNIIKPQGSSQICANLVIK